jgi:hypothetical protein
MQSPLSITWPSVGRWAGSARIPPSRALPAPSGRSLPRSGSSGGHCRKRCRRPSGPPMAGAGWSALETIRGRARSPRRMRQRPRLRLPGVRGSRHESIVPPACVAWVAASPRTRSAPGHAYPKTHGGALQHPHEVDRVLAVLDTREIVVYGRDLGRPLEADGEAGQTTVASIPIGRPASADVLKASCAACGTGHGRRPAPPPGMSSPTA